MAYKITLLALLSLSTTGCFAPMMVSKHQPECQLATRQFELTLSGQGSQALTYMALEGMLDSSNGCHSPECLLIVPLGIFAVSATSLIVSGSIVVVGNTIHWIEKQGKCQNSLTQTLVNNVADSMTALGGKTIQSTTELMTWFRQRLEMD